MSSSRKTPYYNLSQFDDHDKPTWRGDYNGDMSKIDTGMQEVKTSAIDAKTAAQNAESSISEVKRDYLKKTDAQDTYATKTELNETKTTIENNANSKFVSKTVYEAAIASKADKTDVYTKTQADETFARKTEQSGTQSQLDALEALTRPLTSWAAYSHLPNDERKSISSSSPSVLMRYPEAEKTNSKYVTYTENDGHFIFTPGSYLIMARGRIQNVAWSDSQKRSLRAQFHNMSSGVDITFDDCKQGSGDNQEYSMWGLLHVPAGKPVTASMNLSYWTPPSGVTATFKVEEATIAIILLQSETYDAE